MKQNTVKIKGRAIENDVTSFHVALSLLFIIITVMPHSVIYMFVGGGGGGGDVVTSVGGYCFRKWDIAQLEVAYAYTIAKKLSLDKI